MTSTLSRYDRLERWAELLEAAPMATLTPFRDVELLRRPDQDALREANSPLAIAYDDPLLRLAGLGSDRFGDGAAFFGLSRNQAHRVLCSCGYIGMMRTTDVVRRIRRLAARDRLRRLLPERPLPALARYVAQRLLGQLPAPVVQRG